MAGRKWNGASVAGWIVETARARAETVTQAPLAGELELLGRLASLSTLELRSLGVRLGRYAWSRRLYDPDLLSISRALLRAQANGGEEPAPEYRAFLSVLSALLESLRYGEVEAVPRCGPSQIEGAARDVWRDPKEERQVVDTLLVRSILEPLIGGDRSAFRALLATLGREVVTLAAAGTDGRLPGVTEFYGYAQLRSLQDALNGVLQSSHVTTRVSSETRAAV
jgi:hypothetical protein